MTEPLAATDNPHVLAEPDGQLVLDLDGYDGPLDALLALARDNRIDLTSLSILALADQYLAFIERYRRIRLELAGDYLVMAAWLVYLKSRLLLPRPPSEEGDDEPDPQALADALAFQLKRLDALRRAGSRLMARPRLGVDIFPRGGDNDTSACHGGPVDLSLAELLDGYAAVIERKAGQRYQVARLPVIAASEILPRLRGFLDRLSGWIGLTAVAFDLFPEVRSTVGETDPVTARSVVASTLLAALELVRDGLLEIDQTEPLGPVSVQPRANPKDVGAGGGA